MDVPHRIVLSAMSSRYCPQPFVSSLKSKAPALQVWAWPTLQELRSLHTLWRGPSAALLSQMIAVPNPVRSQPLKRAFQHAASTSVFRCGHKHPYFFTCDLITCKVLFVEHDFLLAVGVRAMSYLVKLDSGVGQVTYASGG